MPKANYVLFHANFHKVISYSSYEDKIPNI